MKFAIGSRAYGKNSPFLAESDCFLIACVKKKPSMRSSREKERVNSAKSGDSNTKFRDFFNDGRNVRKSQLRIEKKCAIIEISVR